MPFLMQNTSMVSFDGGSASKVDDVTASPSDPRWRIFVTMITL